MTEKLNDAEIIYAFDRFKAEAVTSIAGVNAVAGGMLLYDGTPITFLTKGQIFKKSESEYSVIFSFAISQEHVSRVEEIEASGRLTAWGRVSLVGSYSHPLEANQLIHIGGGDYLVRCSLVLAKADETTRSWGCVYPNREVDQASKSAFTAWLRENLRVGDEILGLPNCSRPDPAPRVFDHWKDGFPRQKSGERIMPHGIYRINGKTVQESPYYAVIERESSTERLIAVHLRGV